MGSKDEPIAGLFQGNAGSLNWKESIMRLYCAKEGGFTGAYERDPQRICIDRDPQEFFMDGLEIRRKRALYRANHRGTKELDLILGRYAQASVSLMDEVRLAAFEQFLALPDPDIDLWIRGAGAPEGVAALAADVRAFLGLLSQSPQPEVSSRGKTGLE